MKRTFLMLAAAFTTVMAMAQTTVYDFTVRTNEGGEQSLADYRGMVILVVNTATQCGFTPQYEDLDSLYSRYRDRGFTVLDFPCNQFGGQAPGTDEEIEQFCTLRYGTEFPRFSKVDVNGDAALPLWKWLKEQKGFAGFDKGNRLSGPLDRMLRKADPDYASKPDIKWNFTKFLIDRNGRVVQRFEPTATERDMAPAIETLLDEKALNKKNSEQQ